MFAPVGRAGPGGIGDDLLGQLVIVVLQFGEQFVFSPQRFLQRPSAVVQGVLEVLDSQQGLHPGPQFVRADGVGQDVVGGSGEVGVVGPADSLRESNVWRWTAGGLGVAAIGGGAAMHFLALKSASDANGFNEPVAGLDDAGRQTQYDSAKSSAGSKVRIGMVLYGVGIAGLATAAFLGGDDEEAATAWIVPSPASVAWSGRF